MFPEKRLCNRKPDVELLGFQYFDKPVRVLSMYSAVDEFYKAKQGGSIDEMDVAFARMLAVRSRVLGEPLQLVVDVFLYRMEYQTSWNREALIKYIKELTDHDLSILTNKIVVDHSVYNDKMFYQAMKDLEINYFQTARLYRIAKLMDGTKLTQEKIAKDFEISIDGVKGFLRSRQYVAKLIKLYNHTVNLLGGSSAPSEKYLKEFVPVDESNISQDEIVTYLESDPGLRVGIISKQLINNIRKDLIIK